MWSITVVGSDFLLRRRIPSLGRDYAGTLTGMRVDAQLGPKAFNGFNHVNFANPVSTISSGTYGEITSASSPRVFQIGLKVPFRETAISDRKTAVAIDEQITSEPPTQCS